MDEPSDIGKNMSSVRYRGAAYGGSCLLPKIGMMFAVDRFSRIVACMQAAYSCAPQLHIGCILDSQVLFFKISA